MPVWVKFKKLETFVGYYRKKSHIFLNHSEKMKLTVSNISPLVEMVFI